MADDKEKTQKGPILVLLVNSLLGLALRLKCGKAFLEAS